MPPPSQIRGARSATFHFFKSFSLQKHQLIHPPTHTNTQHVFFWCCWAAKSVNHCVGRAKVISSKVVLVKTAIMSLLVHIYSVHTPRGRDLEVGELMSHVDPPAGRKQNKSCCGEINTLNPRGCRATYLCRLLAFLANINCKGKTGINHRKLIQSWLSWVALFSQTSAFRRTFFRCFVCLMTMVWKTQRTLFQCKPRGRNTGQSPLSLSSACRGTYAAFFFLFHTLLAHGLVPPMCVKGCNELDSAQTGTTACFPTFRLFQLWLLQHLPPSFVV